MENGSFYHLDREPAPQMFTSAELNEESEQMGFERVWRQMYLRRRVVDLVRASVEYVERWGDDYRCVY